MTVKRFGRGAHKKDETQEMDHEESIQLDAANCYLLGGMSSEDRERFEAHFFECPVCSEEVRAGAIFAENLKSVLEKESLRSLPDRGRPGSSEDPRAPRWKKWFSGLRLPVLVPYAACLLVGLFAFQQHRELALLRQPQAVPSYELRLARGADTIVVRPGVLRFVLSFDLPEGYTSAYYLCEIRSGDGALKDMVRHPVPKAGAPLLVELPARLYPAGKYTLLVRAEDSKSPGLRYPFTLEYRQE